MQIFIVLVVGLHPSLPDHQRHLGQGALYLFRFASSIQEAIRHFKDGDFDAVLLGPSMTFEAKDRLTSLIRSTGSHIPIACIAGDCEERNGFADMTVADDSNSICDGIGHLVASAKPWQASQQILPGVAF